MLVEGGGLFGEGIGGHLGSYPCGVASGCGFGGGRGAIGRPRENFFGGGAAGCFGGVLFGLQLFKFRGGRGFGLVGDGDFLLGGSIFFGEYVFPGLRFALGYGAIAAGTGRHGGFHFGHVESGLGLHAIGCAAGEGCY